MNAHTCRQTHKPALTNTHIHKHVDTQTHQHSHMIDFRWSLHGYIQYIAHMQYPHTPTPTVAQRGENKKWLLFFIHTFILPIWHEDNNFVIELYLLTSILLFIYWNVSLHWHGALHSTKYNVNSQNKKLWRNTDCWKGQRQTYIKKKHRARCRVDRVCHWIWTCKYACRSSLTWQITKVNKMDCEFLWSPTVPCSECTRITSQHFVLC